MDELPQHPDLQAFGPAAHHAVLAGRAEAEPLGHDRVGTEHLLLGVLTDDSRPLARMLSEAGATLPLARRKVVEALPPSQVQGAHLGSLELSVRAARALGRAVRLSHARRTEVVTSEHLLIGVLDVEGTAGQVLRSLGVDVEELRASLDDQVSAPGEEDVPRRPPVARPISCPSCGAAVVNDDLAYRVVRARGDEGRRDAGVFSCRSCGAILGVVPA